MSRIAGLKKVTLRYSVEVSLCYSNCVVCEKETPKPTVARIELFAHYLFEQGAKHDFMWPDNRKPGCMPDEWEWQTIDDGEDSGPLCPKCVTVRNAAFDTRRP